MRTSASKDTRYEADLKSMQSSSLDIAPNNQEGSSPLQADGVSVCICTYRRQSVFDAVISVANQEAVRSHLQKIIVIDNDECDDLREAISEFAKGILIPLEYVHAPKKNISIARNAALDAVATRWLVFIDDDELAAKDWLLKLLEKGTDADVVFGPSLAKYDLKFPSWVSNCDFHSSLAGEGLHNVLSGNVLMDMNFVRRVGARFLLELGLTGGEDTFFFRQLAEAGARFAHANNAIVHEVVPDSRANMKWVLRRMYRSGQTHGLVSKNFDRRAFRNLWFTAASKGAFCLLMSILTLPGSYKSRKWIARGSLHAGACHYRLTSRMIEEYK